MTLVIVQLFRAITIHGSIHLAFLTPSNNTYSNQFLRHRLHSSRTICFCQVSTIHNEVCEVMLDQRNQLIIYFTGKKINGSYGCRNTLRARTSPGWRLTANFAPGYTQGPVCRAPSSPWIFWGTYGPRIFCKPVRTCKVEIWLQGLKFLHS